MDQKNSVLIRDRGGWQRFCRPVAVLQTSRHEDVLPVLREVQAGVTAGRFAAGFVAYEAAGGLDRAFPRRGAGGVPLVWFGLYDRVEPLDALPAGQADGRVTAWQPAVARGAYLENVRRIERLIHAGDSYQVNYTIRLRGPFQGDATAYFRRLCRAQRSGPFAYLDLGTHVICCASPELFFELDGDAIRSRPMKGTWRRGLTWQDDEANAAALHSSTKNRAENVMIVDMIRNDLGRVAVPGSVHVPSLCEVERYPTVLQMTSTVCATTSADLPELMRNLFPCASITGAPKVRTMQIIQELEPEARGLYTGSIGYLAPVSAAGARRMQFNVAIRTVVIDRARAVAEYGVGGGIVWDSNAEEEYEECMTKAAVLGAPPPEFDLLETLLWTRGEGWFLLDRHVERMRRSAAYFGYPFSEAAVRGKLDEALAGCGDAARRVRLRLDESGAIAVESAPFEVPAEPASWRVALAAHPVDRRDRFLYHKTTHRHVYEEARRAALSGDDVILFNAEGEVTESTIANVVCEVGGRLVTPPVSCGLLGGVFRAHLLETGEIEEGILRVADLHRAGAVYLINSVRRWIRAELLST